MMFTGVVFLFFFPVVFGIQSLEQAIPLYLNDSVYGFSGVRTPWVGDGWAPQAVTRPYTVEVVRMLRERTLPFWTPYAGAGQPLLANMASGMYNPLRLVYFFFFNSARAFDFFILIRLVLMGFGLFLFLRRLGLTRIPSFFGGAAFMFSGFFITNLTIWFNDIYATIPFVLYGIESYFQLRLRKYVFLTGILTGLMILESHPEVTFFGFLLIGAYFLWRAYGEERSLFRVTGHLKVLGAVFVIGLLIAAPMISDVFTLFREGYSVHRPPVVESSIGRVTYPLYSLLHFFVSPSMFYEIGVAGQIYAREAVPYVPYFGIVVLVFALLYAFLRPQHKGAVFFYVPIAFVILKLWGIPPISWLGSIAPFSYFYWHRMFGLVALSFAVLAAFGYESLKTKMELPKQWFYVVVAIPFMLVVVSMVFPGQFSRHYIPVFDFAKHGAELNALLGALPSWLSTFIAIFISKGVYITAVIFLWVTVAYLLTSGLVVRYVKTRSSAVYTTLLVLLLVELWMYMPKIRDGFQPWDPYANPAPYVSVLQEAAKKDTFRIIATDNTFSPHLGDFFRIQDFRTGPAAYPKRYWSFMGGLRYFSHEGGKLLPGMLPTRALFDVPQQFFDMANIKYVVSETRVASSSTIWALRYDKDAKIYENTRTLPRAYMVFSFRSAEDMEHARRMIYGSDFEPRREVALEGVGLTAGALPMGSGTGEARIDRYQADKVVVHTNADRDGILVLADAFYPGWRVFVDGKEKSIYPANVLFRGVFVAEGSHIVEFVYRPKWLVPSLVTSLVTLLFSLRFILVRDRRRHAP
ncbi:MAG: YfhO family protein [Parcubacteria group bacterium]|nr:YfhO family protein [Parcubacteria group bacterium]